MCFPHISTPHPHTSSTRDVRMTVPFSPPGTKLVRSTWSSSSRNQSSSSPEISRQSNSAGGVHSAPGSASIQSQFPELLLKDSVQECAGTVKNVGLSLSSHHSERSLHLLRSISQLQVELPNTSFQIPHHDSSSSSILSVLLSVCPFIGALLIITASDTMTPGSISLWQTRQTVSRVLSPVSRSALASRRTPALSLTTLKSAG